MSTNSLVSLLSSMQGRSVCNDWGAVAVFGRTQLNRLLEEQYLEGLSSARFLPPLSGQLFVGLEQTELVQLDAIMFGKPVLSFESASLTASTVTLTLNIIAGTYTVISHPVTSVQMLSSNFSITEDMGFKVTMEVDLIQIAGAVDRRGRVTLDLSADPTLRCNLGSGASSQKAIAQFIQSFLAAQPEDRRIFALGLFDFSGYNPLSPTGFYIRTQQAPGSDPANGAVLAFIKLKVRDENSSIPIDGSNFPYLIPDDQEQGKDRYSAALVLNHEWVELLDEVQLDVLKNLLFPGENIFVERDNGVDRHQPHDLLVLGNVKPTSESVTIEPAFISIRNEKTQQFTARRSNGSVVGNVRWSASCPDNPLSVGNMSAGGAYTSLSSAKMARDQLLTVVTANYILEGRERSSATLALALFESMSISPRVCTRGVGAGGLPVALAASALGGGELIWPTLTPAEGVLTVIDNNHAVYTPPATLSEPVVLQRIKVRDKLTGETIESTVVLIKDVQTLFIDPPFVSSIALSESVLLHAEDYDAADCQWSVVSSEGGTVKDGVFTPPAFVSSLISVVRCDIVYDGTGPVRRRGFSIILLSPRQEVEPRWRTLEKFSITAPGQSTNCYSNGLQQIPVIIEIETSVVNIDGQEIRIPVSDVELSTLQLVDKVSGAQLPFVHASQEGIEYDSGIRWAVHTKENRFRLYSATASVQTTRRAPPVPRNNSTRYKELYIHLAAEGSRTFYAQFQAADGAIWRSSELEKEGKEIEVKGMYPPTLTASNYNFSRDRAYQDPYGHDEPDDPANPNRDVFSYYLKTIDYWRLTYSRLGAYPVGFATLRIEDNISTIQWESDQVDETFFSYTGYAFNPANYQNSDSPAPDGLSFDPYFRALMRTTYGASADASFVTGKQPSPGELIVSLHRVDDMPYWYDAMAEGNKVKLYRSLLDPGVTFVLLDEEGNRHRLQISFDSPSIGDSRNKLILAPK